MATTSSVASRLPPELWCTIWNELSLEERVCITHVCAGWRAAAIACPALWTCVQLDTDARNRHCTCGPSPFARAGKSNLELVRNIFSRSGALPLYISVLVRQVCVDPESVRDFARDLASTGALSRVRKIQFFSADDMAFSFFMESVCNLPALRELSVMPLGDRNEERDDACPALCEEPDYHVPLGLPALDRLYIDPSVYWNFTKRPMLLPNVQSICVGLRCIQEIIALLRDTSSSLTNLDIVCSDSEVCPCERAMIPRMETIPYLSVRRIHDSFDESWADYFWGNISETRPYYGLHFRPDSVAPWLAFESFSRLNEISELYILSAEDGCVLARARDLTTRRVRDVVFPRVHMESAIGHMASSICDKRVHELVVRDLLITDLLTAVEELSSFASDDVPFELTSHLRAACVWGETEEMQVDAPPLSQLLAALGSQCPAVATYKVYPLERDVRLTYAAITEIYQDL